MSNPTLHIPDELWKEIVNYNSAGDVKIVYKKDLEDDYILKKVKEMLPSLVCFCSKNTISENYRTVILANIGEHLILNEERSFVLLPLKLYSKTNDILFGFSDYSLVMSNNEDYLIFLDGNALQHILKDMKSWVNNFS